MDSLCHFGYFYFTPLFSLPENTSRINIKINKINNKRNKENEGTAAFHTHNVCVLQQQNIKWSVNIQK